MDRYPIALADEALELAFQSGALKLCCKKQHVIVRTNDPLAKRRAFKLAARKIDACQSSFPNPSLLLEIIMTVVEMGEEPCVDCPKPRGFPKRNG